MRRATRIFLVLFFALLQCVSPLAHAHIGGDHSGTRIHIDEVQQQLDYLSVNAVVEPSDSAAVHTPQGKQRNPVQLVFDYPCIQGYYLSLPKEAVPSVIRRSSFKRPLPSSTFRKQYPQAPPAFAL